MKFCDKCGIALIRDERSHLFCQNGCDDRDIIASKHGEGVKRPSPEKFMEFMKDADVSGLLWMKRNIYSQAYEYMCEFYESKIIEIEPTTLISDLSGGHYIKFELDEAEELKKIVTATDNE